MTRLVITNGTHWIPLDLKILEREYADPIQMVKGEFHTVQILYAGLENMSIDIITRTRTRTENKFYSKKLLSLSSFVPAAPCVVSFITNSYLSLNSNIQFVLNTE